MRKSKKIGNPKSCCSLHANDVLRDFVDSNVINAEPKSTKLDEQFLKE